MIQEGSIIGFSGTGVLSAGINLGTGAWPGRGFCHVGIVSKFSAFRHVSAMYESTMLLSDEYEDYCLYLRRPVKGVQIHSLSHALRRGGNVWELSPVTPLTLAQKIKLHEFLVGKLGVPYDLPQAGTAFGLRFRAMLRTMFRRENLNWMYCSELTAAAVDEIHPGTFSNASVWNPNAFAREVVRTGLYHKPVAV